MAGNASIEGGHGHLGEVTAALAAADAALGVALDMFARAVREGGAPEPTTEHAPMLIAIGGRAHALARLSESVLLALVVSAEGGARG